MLPHEANFEALKGIRKTVAGRLGKSASLLDKYTTLAKPDGDGEKSPTQAFVEFVLAVASVDRQRATILLDYVLGECGCLPSICAASSPEPLSFRESGESTARFAEYLKVIGQAQANDGEVTAEEIPSIAAAIESHIAGMGRQLQALRRMARAADEAQFAERIGPKRSPRLIQLRRATPENEKAPSVSRPSGAGKDQTRMTVSTKPAVAVKPPRLLRHAIRDMHHAFPSLEGKPFIYVGRTDVPDHFLVDVYENGERIIREHIAHADEIFYTADDLIGLVGAKLARNRGFQLIQGGAS